MKSSLIIMGVAIIAVLASSCATQAALTVASQPEGAFITEKGTGRALGTAPVTLFYDVATLLRSRDAEGCYLVKGLEAHWVSGTAASLEVVRLCGSDVGHYSISFNRDPTQPGLDKDLQFGIQVQALRSQQQQAAAAQQAARAAQDAADTAFFSALANERRTNVTCTSVQIGNTVQTTCK